MWILGICVVDRSRSLPSPLGGAGGVLARRDVLRGSPGSIGYRLTPRKLALRGLPASDRPRTLWLPSVKTCMVWQSLSAKLGAARPDVRHTGDRSHRDALLWHAIWS